MEKTAQKQQKIAKTAHIRGLEEEWVSHATTWGIDKMPFSSTKDSTIDTLYNTVKFSPEITACITAIVEDIMADGWKFFGSKDAIKKAQEFQRKAGFYKHLANIVFDALISGNGYSLKLSVNEAAIKKITIALTKKIAEALCVEKERKVKYEFLKQDKTFGLFEKKPKDIQMLKASTIKINFDETGVVKSYEQQVMGKRRAYRAKDIIHLDFLNIGGQPYGFTPLEPLLSDVATLIFAKNFAGQYFENDGVPYFLFNLPEATPDDRNYELLKKELKEMKKSKNKYRTLVTTGKVDHVLINKFNKDMEFGKLIRHFTQLILMSYGTPAHRVNWTLDVKETAAELGKVEGGYYKKISFMQKIIENVYNAQLWNHFHVEMKFNRSYKLDEMREAQIAQIAAQTGFMTIEEIRERMGMEPKLPKGTMPNSIGDDKAINFRRDKKDEKGQEEKEDKEDNKLKSFDNAVEVTFANLELIVELKLGLGRFDQANILYFETDTEFIMFFSDGMWQYKARVKKSEVDVETFKEEKLRNAVKIFM